MSTPVAGADKGRWFEKTTEKGKNVAPVGGDRVTVAVRVRPMLKGEGRNPDGDGENLKAAIVGNSELNTIESYSGKVRKRDFQFDYVFTDDQYEIYDCIGRDMLKEGMAGYNVCLFAYGQTGSGKTYTVQGIPGAGIPSDLPQLATPENEGILPRLVRDLFNVVEERLEEDSTLNIKITMSFVEVYNEKVRDLLPLKPVSKGQEPPSLDIVQGADKRIEVRGLCQHTVMSAERVMQLLIQANRNRQVAETKMNECSSRSHTIMQLYVVQQYETPSVDKKDVESLITIVDLAGSERQSKTEAQGQTLAEAKYINHSLLMLGRALNSFSSKETNTHVPLRESKLTRLLSESFGGNNKTWMLATVAPSAYNFSESTSTLNYASNAKFIRNHAKQNRLERALEMKDLKEMNKKLEDKLEDLRSKSEVMRRQIERLRRENDEISGGTNMDDGAALIKIKENLKTELSRLQEDPPPNSGRVGYSRADSWIRDGSLPVSNLNNMYIGRAKVSLRNIIEQNSAFFNLPLTNESGVRVTSKATLMVKIYPVDAKGAVVTQSPAKSERGLLGQRVDFVVHIISAMNIPKEFSNNVFCEFVYKWAEKDSYKTADASGTNPKFDFRKRFAFSKMNVGLVEYFRSDNVITFMIIGT
eukprot:TRINITY_DN20262_c0_g1_i2.p1 TRINITY_DN20262_c0_g1~~TRINITY_DN20262_c0_g1_i2.p1  ORF type:complete len:643 (+),score=132.67 TRINITY_DN20262_c0_g1_i2:38-1966(+)